MADTPETPDTSAAEQAKPAPRRRGPARKPATARQPRAAKSVVTKAEEAVFDAAGAAKDAVTGAAETVTKAIRPRASARATPRAAPRSPASGRGAAAARSGESAKREPAKREPAKREPAKRTASKRQGAKKDSRSTLEKATGAVTGRIGAAIAGGVAAAALLALRGSARGALGKTPAPTSPANDQGAKAGQSKHAHQPDGTDSSQSFQAGIADENTVPEQA